MKDIKSGLGGRSCDFELSKGVRTRGGRRDFSSTTGIEETLEELVYNGSSAICHWYRQSHSKHECEGPSAFCDWN